MHTQPFNRYIPICGSSRVHIVNVIITMAILVIIASASRLRSPQQQATHVKGKHSRIRNLGFRMRSIEWWVLKGLHSTFSYFQHKGSPPQKGTNREHFHLHLTMPNHHKPLNLSIPKAAPTSLAMAEGEESNAASALSSVLPLWGFSGDCHLAITMPVPLGVRSLYCCWILSRAFIAFGWHDIYFI